MTRRLNSSDELNAMLLLEQSLEVAGDNPEPYIRRAIHVSTPVRERALELLDIAHRGTAIRTGAAGKDAGLTKHVPPPERVGQYRILRLLGRGGMGAVYLGERIDADFDHMVAVKIVHPHLNSATLADRFRRERQILASLHHPHIAHLHDGGELPDGSPYIVMEYVDGINLARWLSEASPPLDQRLRLMLQICDAVEFAHQNLIIHRDLTPGNILVNDRGDTKLIDFGIARPHGDEQAALPQSTLTKLSLTPGFAAPERIDGAPATTLIDIFSLGRILDAMVRGFGKPELAAIIVKATQPDPADRYASAALLAAEIEAFQQGAPVDAYSTARGYRVRRFVTRHRVPAAFGGFALALLIVGLIGMTMAYRAAEEARAETEQRFGEVRALSNYLLFDLYDRMSDVPGTTELLNDIADRSRLYLDTLSRTKNAPFDVRLEAAQSYKRLADVLGTPIGANLGRREEADKVLQHAINELRALHRTAPAHRDATRALAEALYSRAVFEFIALDDSHAAIEPASEAARLYWSLASGREQNTYTLRAIDAEIEAALPLVWIDKGAQGVASLKATLAKLTSHMERQGKTAESVSLLARAQSAVAETLGRHIDTAGGDYTEALDYADQAVASYENNLKMSDKPDAARRSLAIALYKRSLLAYGLENYPRALTDLDRALPIITDLISRDEKDAGLRRVQNAVLEQKAIILAHAGRAVQALGLARQSLDSKRQASERAPDNPGLLRDYAANLLLVGEVAELAQQRRQACQYYRAGKSAFEKLRTQGNLSNYDASYTAEDVDGSLERTCL